MVNTAFNLTMKLAADDDTHAELSIFDIIVAEPRWLNSETSSVSVARFLAENKNVKTIDLLINSVGGDVYEATAIYNILSRHSAKVHVHIVGLAASAASLIAMSGDTISMAANALMMIHQPWTFDMGDSADLRKTADVLDKITDTLVSTYAARSGQDEAPVRAWVMAETWFSAAEAVAAGFADEVTAAKKIAASADLSRFRNIPAALVAAMNLQPQPMEPKTMPEPTPGTPTPGIAAPQNAHFAPQASLNDIRNACTGCDDAFIVEQMGASASVEKAQQAWINTLAARVENRDTTIAQRDETIKTMTTDHEAAIKALDANIENIKLGASDNDAPGAGDGDDIKKTGGIKAAIRMAGQPTNN